MPDNVLWNTDDDITEQNLSQAAAKKNLVDYFERGCNFNPDYGTGEVEIGSGHAVIRDGNQAWDVFPDARTGTDAKTLPNSNGMNYLYLTFNPDAADVEASVAWHVDSDDSPPGGQPALKRGWVDTSAQSAETINGAPSMEADSLSVSGAMDAGSVETETAEITNHTDGQTKTVELNEVLPVAYRRRIQGTNGVGTTAEPIIRVGLDFGFVKVVGKDGSANNFLDVLTFVSFGSPTVLHTATNNSPENRSYSVSGREVELSMGSGSYDITAVADHLGTF